MTDIRPWYKDDIARILISSYSTAISASRQSNGEYGWTSDENAGYRRGFLASLVSVALAVGVNPESFLFPEDIQFIRRSQ